MRREIRGLYQISHETRSSVREMSLKFDDVLSCLKDIRQNMMTQSRGETTEALSFVPEVISSLESFDEMEAVLLSCDRNPTHEAVEMRNKMVKIS